MSEIRFVQFNQLFMGLYILFFISYFHIRTKIFTIIGSSEIFVTFIHRTKFSIIFIYRETWGNHQMDGFGWSWAESFIFFYSQADQIVPAVLFLNRLSHIGASSCGAIGQRVRLLTERLVVQIHPGAFTFCTFGILF